MYCYSHVKDEETETEHKLFILGHIASKRLSWGLNLCSFSLLPSFLTCLVSGCKGMFWIFVEGHENYVSALWVFDKIFLVICNLIVFCLK